MKRIRLILIGCAILVAHSMICAQPSTFVDEKGIWRWTGTKEEICLFGANYSEPFSSFEEHEELGVFHEDAIDADVYHLARLGFSGYRLHMWDGDITDGDGNLKFNKPMQAFDYLLFKLKERGIKIFITPMKFDGGPNGYVNKFGGKIGCLNNRDAFPVQENYLAQLLNHVNPYTGIAYKDDPDIIGVEICNEPYKHDVDKPALAKEYIDRMAAAIRSTGYDKPIFYNASHMITELVNLNDCDIQGGTFQWYPTGLYSNHDHKGNMLPNVDQYIIPFVNDPEFENKAIMAYEFSPSDMAKSSYMYPAMARSFREAGFQFATQFAYSPMNVGFANIEWRAHYLSLPWAPSKTMGMLVAAEAFHKIPLRKSYGRYPDNNKFAGITLNYENDLAEFVSETKFFYSNQTNTAPPKPENLMQLAGTGSSPVVSYSGTGAYFLDKLDDGVWRLEVMPDAIFVRDPHFSTAMDREVSIVEWNEQQMQITLPNIGEGFTLKGLNEGNTTNINAEGKSFTISPGAYLLTRKGTSSNLKATDKIRNLKLGEFYAPKSRHTSNYVVHKPKREISAGSKVSLSADVVKVNRDDKVDLVLVKRENHKSIPMKRTGTFSYSVEVPEEYTNTPGFLQYYISVGSGEQFETFPARLSAKHPMDRKVGGNDRKFMEAEPYTTRVMEPSEAICIFDAQDDADQITNMYRQGYSDFVPSSKTGKTLVHIIGNGLNQTPFDNNKRMFCRERLNERKNEISSKKEILIHGHSLFEKPCKVQLALVMRNGSAYGGVVEVGEEESFYSLKISKLKPVETYLMARPIPRFLPITSFIKSEFDINEVEYIQFTIGPGIEKGLLNEKHGVALGRILLD